MYSEPLAGGIRPQGDQDDRAPQGGHPGDSQRMVHHGPNETGVALVIETFQHKLRRVGGTINC